MESKRDRQESSVLQNGEFFRNKFTAEKLEQSLRLSFHPFQCQRQCLFSGNCSFYPFMLRSTRLRKVVWIVCNYLGHAFGADPWNKSMLTCQCHFQVVIVVA